MNPFDLRGPAFLAFYSGLMMLVLFYAQILRWRAEEGALPKLSDIDPYALAYLRAGAQEVLVVSLVSLLDRGLLAAQGSLVMAVESAQQVRRPFERALLSHFASATPAIEVFSATGLLSCTQEVERDLIRRGLLPSELQRQDRTSRAIVCAFVLGGVGAVKLVVAFVRGKHNVLFLLVLMAVAAFLIVREQRTRRTKLGDDALRDAQELCQKLRKRSESLTLGSGSYDLTLLIGAFGLSALRGQAREALAPLFPRTLQRPAQNPDTTSPSSCGSSCGTVSSCGSSSSSCGSSSSSCGSSCGGGCGGCGGGGD